MKTQLLLFIGIFLVSGLLAQKGTGDKTGLAQRNKNVSLVELTGMVSKTEIGPCKNTTGRSVNGFHLFVVDGQTEYNIHLGPADAIKAFSMDLKKGDEVQVVAFQTEKLPPDQYIAKTLRCGGGSYELRDENLRPFWAIGRGRGNQ